MLQPVPVGDQFIAVQFGPCLYQASLYLRQAARDKFDRAQSKNANLILVVRMKMRKVMWTAGFREHANDDAKESAQFGHDVILHPE